MQFYMTYSSDGIPTGFYNDEVHGSDIPEEAITITIEDWEKYITGEYYYYAGVPTLKPEYADASSILENLRTALYTFLNLELTAYIGKYYDQGTQASLQAFYILETTPDSIKTKIINIWGWIQSIMIYYYGCKTEISDLNSEEEVNNYEFNFSQFDYTKPDVTLRSIYSELNEG